MSLVGWISANSVLAQFVFRTSNDLMGFGGSFWSQQLGLDGPAGGSLSGMQRRIPV